MKKSKTRTESRASSLHLQEALFQVLSRVDRPGDFFSIGSLPSVLPGLEIEGIGPVAFPLMDGQAEEIKRHCEQAPYGKGKDTIVDTTVRRVWQMTPDRFRLTNPDWDDFLLRIVDTTKEELGIEGQSLVPNLYNILLYEKGSFFLPHRDGEKLDKMIATLVVVLPSAHSGGELIVRHDGVEKTIDFGSLADSTFKTHYAAFYADCQHEVLPLRRGYRLCLVYNLTLGKSKRPVLKAPRNSEHIEVVTDLLQEWATRPSELSPSKLVLTMSHQYSKSGLTWDTLKGVDRARANVFREASRKAGIRAHLAQLTYWEHGSADDYEDYGRRSRYSHSSYSREPGTYEMEEIYDSSLTADHWVSAQGASVGIDPMPVQEEEIVPEDSLRTVIPEEAYEGYMGNYGQTLERWYRHAAIILWPEHRHFEILCDCGTASAVSELLRMTSRLAEDGDGGSKTQCIAFASMIIKHWKADRTSSFRIYDVDTDDDNDDLEIEDNDSDEIDDDYFESEQVGASDFVRALEQLEDATLIRRFLETVVPRDASVELTPSLIRLSLKLRVAGLGGALETIFRSTNMEFVSRNARLFEQLCSAGSPADGDFRALCSTAFGEQLSALSVVDRAKADWMSPELNRTRLLSQLASGLVTVGDHEGLQKLVAHTLARQEKYPLESVSAAALLDLKDSLPAKSGQSEAVSLWISTLLEHLQSRTAVKPAKPADFARKADVSCRCALCKELIEFMKSPREGIHRFSVRKDLRRHLHQTIEKHHLDLDHVTERRGSPQTLVCTKNDKSFLEDLERYKKELRILAELRALQVKL